MNEERQQSGWILRLGAVGLAAAICAWGLNEFAVWQLQKNIPEPPVLSPALERAPKDIEPVVSAEFITEEADDQNTGSDESGDEASGDEASGDEASGDEASRDEASLPAPADAPRAQKVRDKNQRTQTQRTRAKQTRTSPNEPEVRVFSIDAAKLKQQFKRPEDTAGHGRVLPNYDDGQRRGMRFVDVAPAGIFGRLGIESGDVILSVNGTKITTQQKALSDFEKMRKLRTFDVVLERGGKRRHFRYRLK